MKTFFKTNLMPTVAVCGLVLAVGARVEAQTLVRAERADRATRILERAVRDGRVPRCAIEATRLVSIGEWYEGQTTLALRDLVGERACEGTRIKGLVIEALTDGRLGHADMLVGGEAKSAALEVDGSMRRIELRIDPESGDSIGDLNEIDLRLDGNVFVHRIGVLLE